MKKTMVTLIAVLCLSFPGPVKAETSSVDKFCETFAGFSYNTMTLRQMGAPLSDALSFSDGLPPAAREIVMQAYQVPRYHTESRKLRAAQEFQVEAHLLCLKVMQQ